MFDRDRSNGSYILLSETVRARADRVDLRDGDSAVERLIEDPERDADVTVQAQLGET
jgi:hypothetical protein